MLTMCIIKLTHKNLLSNTVSVHVVMQKEKKMSYKWRRNDVPTILFINEPFYCASLTNAFKIFDFKHEKIAHDKVCFKGEPFVFLKMQRLVKALKIQRISQ